MDKDDTNITIKEIYGEILRNRTELKNLGEASEARILLKLETLNDKINNLEIENQQLKDRVELLDREVKKNNLIIFGLEETSESVSIEYICQKLQTLLGIEIHQSDVRDVYRLGKSKNNPVKIEFVSQATKKLVLKNCRQLKGTNISVTHDLTLKQREEGKKLRKHLSRFKENSSNKCTIKGNKLFVKNKTYTIDQLEEAEDGAPILQENNTSPVSNRREQNNEDIQQSNSINPEGTVNTKIIKKQYKNTLPEIRNTRHRVQVNSNK